MANIADEYELTGMLTEDCQYIHFTHWKVFQRALSKWVGKDLVVTVKVLKYKRSLAQNRYMWVIVEYVRHWFYDTQGEKLTKDEVYVWLRKKLLGEHPKIVNIAGEEIITMTGKKFSAMSTKEFSDAVDTIRAKMLERGLDIPEPKKKGNNLIEEFITDD